MSETFKKDQYIYRGTGFPVTLCGFPFKKEHGVEVFAFDVRTLELFIAQIVLLKPAFLTGNEIKFLRTFVNLSMRDFGQSLDVSAAGVKKWEDKDDAPATSVSVDFAIRQVIATQLNLVHKVNPNFAYHTSLLQTADFRGSEEDYKFPYGKYQAQAGLKVSKEGHRGHAH